MMNPAEFANIAAIEENFWWFRGMRRILFSLLDPLARRYNPRRVLETGCGTGHLSQMLERRYGWQMHPSDLAMEGLSYGRGLGVQRMAQADLGALPYRTAVFDAVLSMDVLVHFPLGSEDRPFAEMIRVLRPGGLLILRVSALDMLRSHHSAFTHERQRFTRPRLLAMAARHKLDVLRCTYLNTLLVPVAFTKFRIVEPLLGGEPSSGVQPVPAWLDNLLYLPLALEEKWLRAGLNFPLGQSLLLIAAKNAP